MAIKVKEFSNCTEKNESTRPTELKKIVNCTDFREKCQQIVCLPAGVQKKNSLHYPKYQVTKS